MSNWKDWYGGECPVKAGTMLSVEHRDGEVFHDLEMGQSVECGYWQHYGFGGDIVKYHLEGVSEDTQNQPLDSAYEDLMKRFKEDTAKVMEDIHSDLYCDYLPHVETDTLANVSNNTQNVVERILSGGWERTSDTSVEVIDGNGYTLSIRLTDGQYDSLRKSLLEVMPQCPKDMEIRSLNQRIEDMQRTQSRRW